VNFLGLCEVFLIGIPWGRSYPYRPRFFRLLLMKVHKKCKKHIIKPVLKQVKKATTNVLNQYKQCTNIKHEPSNEKK
jgi:hypothetical protein